MTWNSVMGFISSVALLLPIVFILVLKLGSYRTFPVLLAYYVIIFSYNLLTEGYIKADKSTIDTWNICNNLLDAPLMLFFLTYFSTSVQFTNKIKLAIGVLILLEVVAVSAVGFNAHAIAIFLGPGLLTVFALCLHFFIRQTKTAILHQKALGKAIIAASLLFAYGCYTIIYLMYYVFKTPHIADTFLVYFLVVTFASLLLCAGIFIERKRIQQLNEVKITRRELSDIYKDTPTVARLRTAVLDFDRDQWG